MPGSYSISLVDLWEEEERKILMRDRVTVSKRHVHSRRISRSSR